MRFSIVREIPEDEWRTYVSQNPMGNVFHTPEMFAVFQNTKGYQPELWAARGNDGALLAMFLPVCISLKDGLLRPLTTQSVAYGGVLCSPGEAAAEALQALLRAYQKEAGGRSVFTELRNCCPMSELQPALESVRFKYEDHLNYIISLEGSPETVFKNIGKRTQRNIRRGLNQARVAVEEIDDRAGIHAGYELLRRTYRLAQVPLADRSMFESAFDILQPKGMLRATLAKVDGQPIAASFELLYKNTVYGWYGGMDRGFGSHNPNEMLMWDMLRWGSEKGFTRYDFGGAGKPNEEYGVRDFKAKFGGALVNYGRFKWVASPLLLSVSMLGYKLLRRFL